MISCSLRMSLGVTQISTGKSQISIFGICFFFRKFQALVISIGAWFGSFMILCLENRLME